MFKFKATVLFAMLFGAQLSIAQTDSIFKTTVVIPKVPILKNDTVKKETSAIAPDKAKNSKFHEYKDQLIRSLTVSRPSTEVDKPKLVRTTNNELNQYQGKIIRNISFKQLEVFGQTINDTAAIPKNGLERLGNKTHINTLKFVLNNRLLFKSGDIIDSYVLSENERLYRELPYIDDVRVMVTDIGADSADLTFVVKDVMPLGGSVEIFDVLYGKASISNKSILGLGHEVYYHNSWNGDRVPFYGHKIQYKIPNIRNTFFRTDISYENRWNREEFLFNLSRNFFSVKTRYAGGIGYAKVNSLVNINSSESEVDFNFYDMWLGRALQIEFLSNNKLRTRVMLTTRFNRYEYFKRPDNVNESQFYSYHERDIYLAGLAVVSYGYQKSNLIYGFGRTEDIPYGFSLGTTFGIENSEFQQRPYTGYQYTMGTKLTRYGRLYHQSKFGFHTDEELEQGFFTSKLQYISPLINRRGRYKFRLFNEANYYTGFNRNPDESLSFNNNDIRGLNISSLSGDKLLKNTFETVCYSPHYLLGFRMVYYTFIDFGVVNNHDPMLFHNQIYTGVGGGIRIRNENLVFNTVLIRFAYYPVVPSGVTPETFRLTSTGSQHFNNFIIDRPFVLGYGNQ